MKTLLGFCLYLALLHSVASLTCYSCTHLGKRCSHLYTEKCDSDEMSCVSIVAEGSLGPFSMSMSFKSCVEPHVCRSGYYSASISDTLHSHTNVSCCKTDKCNNAPITISEAKKHTPNGLRCPGCYSLYHDHCKAWDSVKCIHKEDHCFDYGIILHNGTHTQKLAAQGCATKNACVLKKEIVYAGNRSFRGNITHAKCYPAKPHLSHEL